MEDGVDRALLHHAPEVHDGDLVAHLGHHAQVMGDEMMAMCSRCWRLRKSARICAWVVTSSAVVGSSAIRMRGAQDSASAIMARWRSPPLS